MFNRDSKVIIRVSIHDIDYRNDSRERKKLFLKHKSYCSFALPAYFDFAPLLLAVKNALEQKQNGINDIGYKKSMRFR
ncbi:hypothetical protein DMI60_20205 [Escherichia coli]|nr:hypothetical protein [Escherichia coli]